MPMTLCVEAVVDAMGIYQDLDSTQEERCAYLYRYPQADSADLADLYDTYHIPGEVVHDGEFVRYRYAE